MAREITVALVQMAPGLNCAEDNLRKMGEFIETICNTQPTDLVVFPELSYTGTELGLRATTLAERVPGHATNYLAKRAGDYNTHVLFGLVIKEKVESILYNGVACLGPEGDVVSAYHKVHLLGEERQVYRPGFRFINVDADWGPLRAHGRVRYRLPRGRPQPHLGRSRTARPRRQLGGWPPRTVARARR